MRLGGKCLETQTKGLGAAMANGYSELRNELVSAANCVGVG